MQVDIYSIEPKVYEGFFGPIMLSLDYDFLLNPAKGPCSWVNFGEGVKSFADLFFPEQIRCKKNGLKNRTDRKEILESSLLEKLSKSAGIITTERGPILDKYGVCSDENIYMTEAQRLVKNMLSFLKYLLKNSRDTLLVTHNANPKKWSHRMIKEINGGLEGIHDAKINTKDSQSLTYTGEVHWSDYIERVSPRDKFIAHPVPEEIPHTNSIPLLVRRMDIHPLTGGYHFACGLSFNMELERYVNQAIEASEIAKGKTN